MFQRTVFQASAAMETYLRLIIEAWVQRIRINNNGNSVPHSTRAYIAAKRLDNAFSRHAYSGDEKSLLNYLQGETHLWGLLLGSDILPNFFVSGLIVDGTVYPSGKNIKRLFARLGVDDILNRISRNLSRDSEMLIEKFQSVRTALAHSSPPPLTIRDVEDLLTDSRLLVGAIDRERQNHLTAANKFS